LGDRYRLGRVLGRGGTSDVYAATDVHLQRPVAVKVLREFIRPDGSDGSEGDGSDASDGSDGSDRDGSDGDGLGGELALLAGLDHPNLVPLFDGGSVGGRRYVVMELLGGRTLQQELHRPLEERRTARLGLALASALAYIHAVGVVHRDVKPGNILLEPDGSVRLTDFGIARLVDAAQPTPVGSAVGTAAYMAPEQVTGKPITRAVDVYALGLVLLQCLTGRQEYRGTPLEAAVARVHRPPRIPLVLHDDWRALLTEMTVTDAGARPAASAIVPRLRELAAGRRSTGRNLGPATQPLTGAGPDTVAA
jgi:serine/threonine protein kinase